MAARLLAALCLVLGLSSCAGPLATTPEGALTRLIEEAAAGRLPADQYQNVNPVDAETIAQFVYVEEWLDVNGEAVMGVRPGVPAAEGPYRFTRSADGQTQYVISYGWPGPQVRSRVLRPVAGAQITLLGWADLLPWEQLGGVCVITTPREMADEENHPCKQAFVFKITAPR